MASLTVPRLRQAPTGSTASPCWLARLFSGLCFHCRELLVPTCQLADARTLLLRLKTREMSEGQEKLTVELQ